MLKIAKKTGKTRRESAMLLLFRVFGAGIPLLFFTGLIAGLTAGCAGAPEVVTGSGNIRQPEIQRETGYLYFVGYASDAETLEEARYSARSMAREEAARSIRSEIESEIAVYGRDEVYTRLVQRSKVEIDKIEFMHEVYGKYEDEIGRVFFELYVVARMPWPEIEWARTLTRLEKLHRETSGGALSERIAFLQKAEEELEKIYGLVDPEDARSNVKMSYDIREEISRLPKSLHADIETMDLYSGKYLENGLLLAWRGGENRPLPSGEPVHIALLSSEEEALWEYRGETDENALLRLPLRRLPLSGNGISGENRVVLRIEFVDYEMIPPLAVPLDLRWANISLEVSMPSESTSGEGVEALLAEELELMGWRVTKEESGDIGISVRLSGNPVEERESFFVREFRGTLRIKDSYKDMEKELSLRVVGVSEGQIERIKEHTIAKHIAESIGSVLNEEL